MSLRQTKEIEINGKTYIISELPPIAGREIITQYLPSALPKLGDYKANEQLMLKMMSFVSVVVNGGEQVKLSTQAAIDSHVDSWETLLQLEKAMIEYNCSFFQNGLASTFFSGIAQSIPQFITKTLTDSLAQLYKAEKQPSTN